MSDAPSPAPSWSPLPADQRRVLGVLIEKQKTSKTADAYPMTLNSITTGCNQKSNRDPVTDYTEDDVEETLTALMRAGHVQKITGGRAERFKHTLYEQWRVTKVEMAVLAELLLRGPQTEGDLRGRASRMDDIRDLDELRGLLKGLSDRKLVVYLGEPGRRGSLVTHGFHTPGELDRARQSAAAGAAADADPLPARPTAGGSPSPLEAKVAELTAEVVQLKETVARLERELAGLRRPS